MPEANPMLESEEASLLWFNVKLSFKTLLIPVPALQKQATDS